MIKCQVEAIVQSMMTFIAVLHVVLSGELPSSLICKLTTTVSTINDYWSDFVGDLSLSSLRSL